MRIGNKEYIDCVDCPNCKPKDNRCANKKCAKHLSKVVGYRGCAVISKMRNTPDCEGYISKWKKSHEEIEQIKAEMREAGVE